MTGAPTSQPMSFSHGCWQLSALPQEFALAACSKFGNYSISSSSRR